MPAGILVRRAGPSDAVILAPLFDGYRRFYRQPSDAAAAEQFLAERLRHGDAEVFLAERSDRPAGFVLMYPTFSSISLGPVRIVNDLFVEPTVRGHGIGSLLLRTARDHARAAGAHGLELSTAIDNPARFLYEADGWIPDLTFLHYDYPLPPASLGSRPVEDRQL